MHPTLPDLELLQLLDGLLIFLLPSTTPPEAVLLGGADMLPVSHQRLFRYVRPAEHTT
jgi:hypothetical protein